MADQLDDIAAALFRAEGFFGYPEELRATFDIGATVDRIVLSIDGVKDEIINVAEFTFWDADNKIIPRDTMGAVVWRSSAIKDDLNSLQTAFLNGTILHSGREAKPEIVVTFEKPIFVSHFSLANRVGANGKRSLNLHVAAFDGEEKRLDQRAGGPSARVMLDDLLEQIDVPGLLDLPLKVGVQAVRSALAAKIMSGTFSGDVMVPLRTLPLHSKPQKEPDGIDLTIIAHFVVGLLRGRGGAATARLRDFGAILNLPAHIEEVADRANRILRNEGDKDCNVIFAKHRMLRNPVLIVRRDEFLDALETVLGILDEIGMQRCICYGTLLGAVRDKGFMPHDDDVDALYFDGSTTREEAIANRDKLIAVFEERGHSCSATKANFHVRVGTRAVDLFPCWKEGDQIHVMMERFKYRPIDYDIVFPTGTVDLYGHSFPAPAQQEAFLEERYGAGWSVSDPYHEWPWTLNIPDLPTPLRAAEPRAPLYSRAMMVAWGQRVGPRGETPPKNSLGIIDAAVKYGFDAVELDCRFASNGVAVLAHDDLLHGRDGDLKVSEHTPEELSEFCLGAFDGKEYFVETLTDALKYAGKMPVMIDPRMDVSGYCEILRSVDAAGKPHDDLLFCVYGKKEAVALMDLFPTAVLLYKIGITHDRVTDAQLDEAVALGMRGVMLIWPLHDEDCSYLMERLAARGLEVLYYLHPTWPQRPRPDNGNRSLANMIAAGVNYVTTTGSYLASFQNLIKDDIAKN